MGVGGRFEVRARHRPRPRRRCRRSGRPPTSPVSTSGARTGRSPTPKRQMRASPMAPASSRATIAAAPTSAKSPWRRATSWNDQPAFDPLTGTRTSTRHSSSARVGGEVAAEELAGGHDPLTVRPADDQVGLGHHRHGGQLGRRVGVGDAAADRAPVADRHVADEGQGLGQHGEALGHQRRPLGVPFPGRGPEGHGVATVLDAAQRRHPVDVDQLGGPGQPHGQHRDQALAAGDDLGLVAVLGEQGQDLLERSPAPSSRTAGSSCGRHHPGQLEDPGRRQVLLGDPGAEGRQGVLDGRSPPSPGTTMNPPSPTPRKFTSGSVSTVSTWWISMRGTVMVLGSR